VVFPLTCEWEDHPVEIVVANLAAAKTKRVTWNGRDYIVAPLTLIVPGVLPGSQGPLLYPAEEVRKNPTDWNGMPIVVYHPLGPDGRPTSARDPQILEKSGIGTVFNGAVRDVAATGGKAVGKLAAEGWFDVQRTKEIDNRVLEALEKGRPMELSTGLTLRQYPVPEGTVHNGPGRTGPYVAVARDYKPDHLAILPDQRGACSIKDGCVLLVNADNPLARRSTYFHGLVLLTNAKKDQPRVPAGSPQGGQFAHQAGDVVKILKSKIASHVGQEATVLKVHPDGSVTARVHSEGYRDHYEAHEVQATGKAGKVATELDYSPLAGSDKPVAGGTPTQFTLAQLRKTSLQAGKELFDHPDRHENLIYEKVHTVRYRHLDDLRKAGEGLGDFEYVFKPSTGKGVLTKSTDWGKISPKEAADKDGKIYSYSAEGIVFVTETARKGRKGRAHNISTDTGVAMADIAAYFDGSGLGGTVGGEGLWADIVTWEGQLSDDRYLTLHHLMESGWEDDLPALQQDLSDAMRENPPDGAVGGGLQELLDILEGRAEGDAAVAIALNGEEGEEEERTTNELSFANITRELERQLYDKYGRAAIATGGGGLMPAPMDVWVSDVYSDYFVYRQGEKLFTLDYLVDDNDQVNISGDPVEVMRVTDYVPVKNADGSGVEDLVDNASKLIPKGRLNLSPDKACQILKDGQVRGRPLSTAQRGLFGVICGRRRKKTTNSEADAAIVLPPEEVREALRSVAEKATEPSPARSQVALLEAVRNSVRGQVQAEKARDAIRDGLLYHARQLDGQTAGPSDIRELIRVTSGGTN
jgi:hypothetical protein